MVRVLKCDSSSISFSESGQPTISCDDTRDALALAASHVKAGTSPIAFPTETVYGLGAHALDAGAVSRIYKVKGRPADNPLIVHVSSLDMLRRILPSGYQIPPYYSTLIDQFWPGPLSLLFPANPDIVPPIVTAGHPTVAVRMPSHPVARALIALSDCPLAAPSANTSGKPSPTRADHVVRDLGDSLDLIIDGGFCQVGLESTVVDGTSEDGAIRVLRPGGVTIEDLRRALGDTPRILVHKKDYADTAIEQAPTTPGMKYRHYSPSVPVVVLNSSTPPNGKRKETFSSFLESLSSELLSAGKQHVGLLLPVDSPFTNTPSLEGITWHVYEFGSSQDLPAMARHFFDGLLSLEAENVDCIVTEAVEETNEGLAIMNRMLKAASDVRWVSLPAAKP